jgi:hypothetical protein
MSHFMSLDTEHFCGFLTAPENSLRHICDRVTLSMPRREPFTQAEVYESRRVLGDAKPVALPSRLGDARPGEFPSGLNALAQTAGVPTAERGAFVQELGRRFASID